jgi:hypothetical protein
MMTTVLSDLSFPTGIGLVEGRVELTEGQGRQCGNTSEDHWYHSVLPAPAQLTCRPWDTCEWFWEDSFSVVFSFASLQARDTKEG